MKRPNIKDFTIHDFRHTCASRLIPNGLSLYEVAESRVVSGYGAPKGIKAREDLYRAAQVSDQ